MPKVASVRFKPKGKIYYFDPGELELAAGDNVIVETARGLEFGQLAFDPTEVAEEDIVAQLKPVVRFATETETKHYYSNLERKDEILATCQKRIADHGLEMKLVDVEFTYDDSKLIFYFTADGRVDFRELVRDLASQFHTRIELRQIGVRDEMKVMGGIGPCGRELCCHAWMEDFSPVSIKMAKTQNLSLNPIKISGTCGRLMCCLQFENQVYTELRKGMPDHGERLMTPDGEAIVFEVNILENKIKTRLVLEERDGDKPEKLSSEYYIYKKEDVERLGKKRAQQPVKKEKQEPAAEPESDQTAAGEDAPAKKPRRRHRRGGKRSRQGGGQGAQDANAGGNEQGAQQAGDTGRASSPEQNG